MALTLFHCIAKMLLMASFPLRDLAPTVAWIGKATGAIAPS
ncbi:hypothetical protein [Thermosynechococcus sp.]|nr:hypothetical protein [Thermosynechococcus sp.]